MHPCPKFFFMYLKCIVKLTEILLDATEVTMTCRNVLPLGNAQQILVCLKHSFYNCLSAAVTVHRVGDLMPATPTLCPYIGIVI